MLLLHLLLWQTSAEVATNSSQFLLAEFLGRALRKRYANALLSCLGSHLASPDTNSISYSSEFEGIRRKKPRQVCFPVAEYGRLRPCGKKLSTVRYHFTPLRRTRKSLVKPPRIIIQHKVIRPRQFSFDGAPTSISILRKEIEQLLAMCITSLSGCCPLPRIGNFRDVEFNQANIPETYSMLLVHLLLWQSSAEVGPDALDFRLAESRRCPCRKRHVNTLFSKLGRHFYL